MLLNHSHDFIAVNKNYDFSSQYYINMYASFNIVTCFVLLLEIIIDLVSITSICIFCIVTKWFLQLEIMISLVSIIYTYR